jgi:four helix bundle protein
VRDGREVEICRPVELRKIKIRICRSDDLSIVKDFGPTHDLTARAKHFAIRVIQMCGKLPRTPEARVIGTQIVRSSTSVAANYPAACRARSRAEFIAKLGIVVEEADETIFWLELLTESGITPQVIWPISRRRQESCWQSSRHRVERQNRRNSDEPI